MPGSSSHAHTVVPETARFVPGQNCWRVAPATRVAVLVDAAAYFEAVAAAIARARRSILILSWDIDSRTPLAGGCSERRLAATLHDALARRPDLEVHVLNWDFALIYVLERELLAAYRRDWSAHPRLHFHADNTHPLGGSHHQKVVVVDDAVAFVGGLDICARRWDTPAHDPADGRRVDLAGVSYPPFHDVQIAVDGAAARALGELARTRWEQATGEPLPRPDGENDAWPTSIAPSFTDVEIAIARTIPKTGDSAGIFEVERLFIDAIRDARRWIYVENQYLTCTRIGDALLARLAEADGPEIVLVVPREGCGWLEEQTMSMRRQAIVDQLCASDHFDHLRIYAPVIDGSVVVNVHSKVMIVDDTFLRVGSANLSNRSMAVDTECDVALAATDDDTAAGIAAVRDGLLAEHLGATPAEVATTMAETRSLIGAIARLRGRVHTLEPLPTRAPGWLDGLPDEAHVFDPTEPIDAGRLLAQLLPVPAAGAPRSRDGFVTGVVSFATVIAIGFGLRWLGARIFPRPSPTGSAGAHV